MAYRQLYAVTFAALGLIAVACGGGTSSAVATDASEEQPPTSSEQAPNNAGDTATNPDKAPSNPDAPPGSSEAPAGSGGGGRLAALCEKVCSTLKTLADDCSDGMTMIGMQDACSAEVNCQVPPDLPCQNEIADAFDCVFDNLAQICAVGQKDKPDPKPGAEPCQDVTKKLTACADANDLGNMGNDNPPGNQGTCTTAGGCECDSACSSCRCAAGADMDAKAVCDAAVCATP